MSDMDRDVGVEEVLGKLSLEDKIKLQTGKDFGRTEEFPDAGLKGIRLVDGPSGLRLTEHGVEKAVPEVAMPTLSALANSFDEECCCEVGSAIAKQCLSQDVNVILGPGVNIKRNPLNGRNFEYFSEDPYLSGKLGAAWINGVQSNGVGSCVKHFCCNSTEPGRFYVDSVVDERALREIYLSQFEYIIKNAKPYTLMTSYNRVNGEQTASSKFLMTDVLRKEWGFDGLVMTDWGANDDRIAGIKAGVDLQMPHSDTAKVADALKRGALTEEELDNTTRNVIALSRKFKDQVREKVDHKAQHQLAVNAASKCVVMMKNEDFVMPLRKGDKIVVVGPLAKKPHIGGTGSSKVNAVYPDSLCSVLDRNGMEYRYYPGFSMTRDTVDPLLEEQVIKNIHYDTKVIIVAGTHYMTDGESYNRESYDLPRNMLHLINRVAALSKRTIVVIQSGGPVSTPFRDNVKGLVYEGLAGEGSGEALYNVITGKVNPSGRLSETWNDQIDSRWVRDSVTMGENLFYDESIYVGYRYNDKTGLKPAFPFGWGLSYTDFDYSRVVLTKKKIAKGAGVAVTLTVTNKGYTDGADVVMVFVADKTGGAFKAVKQLKGFAKVYLKAGESKHVRIDLDAAAFRFWDTDSHSWQIDGGEYDIIVAKNAEDYIKVLPLTVEGEHVSRDRSDELPGYYDLEGGLHLKEGEFEKLYGRRFPAERKKGDPIDRNTFLWQIADEKPFGKAAKFAYNRICRILDAVSPDTRVMLDGLIPKSSLRSLLMTGFIKEQSVDGIVDSLNKDKSGIKKLIEKMGL
ncbi:MAG: glycoside hydrolase family 3 C-terminal domain-containing protein [Clostridiales bacterium]|nr:glycoside hydrolase family 3 C-terminal domain-containing protein [Clostridiales bacterium]